VNKVVVDNPDKETVRVMKYNLTSLCAVFALPALLWMGAAAHAHGEPDAKPSVAVAAPTPSELEASFGIQIVSTKLSGNNYLVDVRYRVVDAQKARPILDKSVKPVLVQTQTGDRFYVPTPPIVGALRQTVNKSRPIIEDRVYFLLFANPNQKLKAGDQVTLGIGEFSKPNLEIQ
jgi:hypothetical protein